MHKEILTKEQVEILPFFKKFSGKFGLVGGTAIALYIGHRRSIDFDFFSLESFNNLDIRRKLSKQIKIDQIIVNKVGEFTIIINGVKITFYHYPFKIDFESYFNDFLKMPDLLILAAMKAYAVGMRAKWKDYVDLYFIMEKHHGAADIIKKAKQIFKNEFNEKIFRVQLSYFKDINYTEKIIYMKGFEMSDKDIKSGLIDFSLR